MKSFLNNEEWVNFFQEGIVNDLMYATRHYIIWRTVGENYLAIKNISNRNIENLFGQLQSSSADLAVLSLAKIFDRKNKAFKVRSIDEFLGNEFETTAYFPLNTKDYVEFSLLKSRLGMNHLPSKFEHPTELAKFFKEIFNHEYINRKIEDLKFIRNKFIAHNEHDVNFEHLDGFWDDFLKLIDIIKIFISLFGVTVFGTHYFQFEDFKEGSMHYSIIHGLYWMVEEIERAIGKENFKYWWII